jgi:uncharacterized protein YxeA
MRFSLIALILLTLVTGGYAREKKLSKADIPPAVQATVDEQSHGATVTGFTSERKKGKKTYEASMMVNGHTKDVIIDESGKVVEVEEEVSFSDLPRAVQDGLKAEAGAKEIKKVESLTKDGKLVAYEAVVQKMARHFEIQVGPDGSKLKHNE